MTKSLTLALMISLLSFLSLGATSPNAAGVQFFMSDGVSLSDTSDDAGFDL